VQTSGGPVDERSVTIEADGIGLEGDLTLPETPGGLVVFAHGSGSSRLSPRNREVARYLASTANLGTLLFDLLTPAEDMNYETRFDIGLLARRLGAATDWVKESPGLRDLATGYFGASTGAAAALVAASRRDDIAAIVSRGGRPDLAGAALGAVQAPTLLIVGGADPQVITLNAAAKARMSGTVELIIVPGATHLFEEPGALTAVSQLAADWFSRYLR